MGLRLGMAAKEALNGSGKLWAKCFTLSCPVDGIQVGAGTTYGNKALEVEDRNELYLILTDIASGRQVEAGLTKKAEEMVKNYRDLSSQGRSYAPGSPDRLRVEREKDAILEWFRTAPDSEIVTIRTAGH
jgi:formylmethanofuran dehydrogenase subunit E